MILPNDWEIKKCLSTSLASLLATLGLVGLAALGFDIPILRQVVGFILLTFIPGILILRILKIHNIGVVESLLYSVGLSLAVVYFSGLFANFVLPFMGISKPISLLPVTAALAIFTLILGAVAYERDKAFPAPPSTQFSIGSLFSRPYLLLLLLPLLAIFGTYLVNAYDNNFVLLFLLAVIACVVALAAFDRLPKNAYPLAVGMIAIRLLFHLSLISPTLYGSDIQIEYYFQHIVLQNGYWDASTPHAYNTCLSIVFLSPIYSLMLNMDGVWLFKIIYPLFFCLVPLALFHIVHEQIGAKKAFLAAFFFMVMPFLIPAMITHARQEIAKIFFALLILLLIERKLALNQRATLAIVFAVSLIMSHYALGYICLFFLLAGWAIVAFIRSHAGKRAWGWLTHKFGSLPQMPSPEAFPHKIMAVIICVYVFFALGWYGGIGQGIALNTIRWIGQQQYFLLTTEPTVEPTVEPTEPSPVTSFFESPERESTVKAGLGYGLSQAPIVSKAFRIFQYLVQLFIVIGFLAMLLRPKRFKFRPEFIALTVGAALILFACIVIPRFSAYLGFERFYHISLLLLAPLCILGGEAVWQGAGKVFKFIPALKVNKESSRLPLQDKSSCHCEPQAKQSHDAEGDMTNNSNCLRFLALAILIPYFLFTSGFIYAFSSQPASIALGPYKTDQYALHNRHEVDAAAWLAKNLPDDSVVYADATGSLLLYQRLYGRVGRIPPSGEIPGNAYVFLRTWNIEHKEVLVPAFQGVDITYVPVHLMNRPALAGRLEHSKVIYDNGGARILAPIDYD